MKKYSIISAVTLIFVLCMTVFTANALPTVNIEQDFDRITKEFESTKQQGMQDFEEARRQAMVQFEQAKAENKKMFDEKTSGDISKVLGSDSQDTQKTPVKTTDGSEESDSAVMTVSFENLNAYLKYIEEQTGKTIISEENFRIMTDDAIYGITNSFEENKSIKNPIIYLLISFVIVGIVIFTRSKTGYKKQKALNRVNGKKSIFDFGDTLYSFKNDFDGFDFSNQQFMMDEMNRQHMEWAMEECRKAGTPFDQGGYMQGYGFNPSDTMAADMQHQMDSMNNMNNMGGMF